MLDVLRVAADADALRACVVYEYGLGRWLRLLMVCFPHPHTHHLFLFAFPSRLTRREWCFAGWELWKKLASPSLLLPYDRAIPSPATGKRPGTSANSTREPKRAKVSGTGSTGKRGQGASRRQDRALVLSQPPLTSRLVDWFFD
jgi:hypothetical protein